MDTFEDFELAEDDEQEENNKVKITIASTLADLAGTDTFADVNFIVGQGKEQRSIPAHRVILAVNSDVFEAMLYPFPFDDTDTKENNITSDELPEVIIKDVNPLAFRTMLHCLYSDKSMINSSELVDLIYVAQKFQLRQLNKLCQDFLKNGINVDNVCTLYSKAQKVEEVKVVALSYIEDEAKGVFKTTGFLNLNKECIKQILSSDQLNIDEIEVFSACMEWCKAECKRQKLEETTKNKKNLLQDILPLIRFPVMKIEDIASTINPSKILLREDILQLFTYLGTEKENRTEVKVNFNTQLREAVLKWDFHILMKSERITLDLYKARVCSNTSSSFAYCIGNKPMAKGKHCWQVEQYSFGDDDASWLMLGVSAMQKYTDASSEMPTDQKIWGISSDGKKFDGKGGTSDIKVDLASGPFHLLLDCDEGTLDIVNLKNKKEEIYNLDKMPKKTSVTSLAGGGYVPYFNLKKSSITITVISYKEFNQQIE